MIENDPALSEAFGQKIEQNFFNNITDRMELDPKAEKERSDYSEELYQQIKNMPISTVTEDFNERQTKYGAYGKQEEAAVREKLNPAERDVFDSNNETEFDLYIRVFKNLQEE